MDRVLQNTPATASVVYTSGDTVADPGAVTVTITREDGTALVTGASASGTGATTRLFSLTTTHTASLDLLRLDWTSSTLGTITTYVEIVGGYLFGLSDARGLKPLDNTTSYPAASVVAARTLAEMALEDACGVAFVPRYAREVRTGRSCELLPKHPRPLSVVSAIVDGSLVTDAVIDDENGAAAAVFYRSGGWGSSRRGVAIKYTHGYQFPPPRVGRACLLLAKRFLVDSPISDRVTTMTTPDGGTQFMVTAGVRDAVFDVPECNAVVAEYGLTGNVA